MARLRLEILLAAIEEAREARAWYAVRSPIAAVRFDQELDRAIDQIHGAPDDGLRTFMGRDATA